MEEPRPTGLAALTDLQWWVIFFGLAELGILLALLVWALIRAATLPQPGLLVMAISLITVLIMVVYLITRETEVLTLAGVPVGALVSAATGIFSGDYTATQKVVTAVSERLEEATPTPPDPDRSRTMTEPTRYQPDPDSDSDETQPVELEPEPLPPGQRDEA